jgi:hypothetical protein
MNDLGFSAADAAIALDFLAPLSVWDKASISALGEPQQSQVSTIIDRMGDESYKVGLLLLMAGC